MSQKQALLSEPQYLAQARNLEIHNLGECLLRNINLNIEPGNHIAVIGPQMSGKSALLECLAGTLKPSKGYFEVNGTVARVRQRPALISCKSVFENIQFGRIAESPFFSGQKLNEARCEVERRAGLAGLQDKLDCLVSELSEFERFKTAIVRASLQEADLLLVDEYSGDIPGEKYRELLQLIARLNLKQKTTIVAVIPDYELATEFANTVLAFEKGVLLYDTSSDSPWHELAARDIEQTPTPIEVDKEKGGNKSSANWIAMLLMAGVLLASFYCAWRKEFVPSWKINLLNREVVGVGVFESLSFVALVAPTSFACAWLLNSFIAQTRSRILRTFVYPFIYRLRALPALLWGFAFVPLTGVGYLTALLALFVSSFLYLFSEMVLVSRKANQASARELRELGATKRQQYLLAIWPYTKKRSQQSFIRSLTRTITEALLVGLCGCGGLGTILLLALDQRNYSVMLSACICCFVLFSMAHWIRAIGIRTPISRVRSQVS